MKKGVEKRIMQILKWPEFKIWTLSNSTNDCQRSFTWGSVPEVVGHEKRQGPWHSNFSGSHRESSNINSCNPFSDALGQIWGTAQSPPCPARVSNLDEFKSCGHQLYRCLQRSSVNQDKSTPASHAPWVKSSPASHESRVHQPAMFHGHQQWLHMWTTCKEASVSAEWSALIHQLLLHVASLFIWTRHKYVWLSSSREAQQGPYLLIKASLLLFSLPSPPQIPLFLQETSKEKQTWRPTPAKPNDQIKSPRPSPNISAPRCLSSRSGQAQSVL